MLCSYLFLSDTEHSGDGVSPSWHIDFASFARSSQPPVYGPLGFSATTKRTKDRAEHIPKRHPEFSGEGDITQIMLKLTTLLKWRAWDHSIHRSAPRIASLPRGKQVMKAHDVIEYMHCQILLLTIHDVVFVTRPQ